MAAVLDTPSKPRAPSEREARDIAKKLLEIVMEDMESADLEIREYSTQLLARAVAAVRKKRGSVRDEPL